ncbi:MAG: HAMP domain-containing protein [Candidatus Zixiibacteriota bacterium]|nr:MAG: HAMP domain-containing protein [candidate division Zixibacteria bacterium]
MKAGFQGRLFRLFLVFSIVPIIIITLIGYYLTTESEMFRPDSPSDPSQIAEYHSNILFDRLESALVETASSQMASPGFPDFVFLSDTDGTEAIKTHHRLSPDLAGRIVEAGRAKSRGFVVLNNTLCQFVVRPIDSTRFIYGGIIHDEAYGALLEMIHRGTAAQNVSRRLRSEYLLFLSLLFIIVSGASILGAWYLSSRLSRRLARPLQQLSKASQKIAAGEFQQQIQRTGDGEVASLIDSFNHMARRLDDTTRRLAQTERVAAWRQVARRFAHELRNPLQPLLVSLYRIEKQLADTDAYDQIYEPLKAASEEVKHLRQLAERFSHLAKLPPPKLGVVDLTALLASISNLYREQLEERDFIVVAPPSGLVVNSDLAYLREALHNLVQNAIDATSKGQRVELRLAAGDDRALIIVSDGGVGMKSDVMAQASLPYYTTKEKGTGLGLAIVEKSIAELGGQLRVESSPDEGTTVTLEIPIR